MKNKTGRHLSVDRPDNRCKVKLKTPIPMPSWLVLKRPCVAGFEAPGENNVVNYHVTSRLRRWLCKKHKVRGPGYSRYPDRYLYRKLSLYQLNRV
jgi:hypothetical protein